MSLKLSLLAYFADVFSRCKGASLMEKNDRRACDALYMHIANYFRSASPEDETRIVQTDFPPIYFQHDGMTPASHDSVDPPRLLGYRPLNDHCRI